MSEPNGKLSSRVMNMKFMRHSTTTDKQPQEERKLALDESRWNSSTKGSRKVIMVKKPKHLIKSNVGITQLKGVPQGRKLFQSENGKTEKKPNNEKENGCEKEDDYDLDQIFKQVKRNGRPR
ncbi:MPP6 (YNR024W) [Zygosaccharomyces parabailii]|uniref:ZYBA0S11-00562g1_1 n=1 Tax=Zygosaccharomyces bailii (strain CLIB 213 / ATCC 58445 / CBS 680 / BCRC 21525 / NBRC 1098 / NCYC 1416 / NRRL Y-2227) TaxID=1333698 RepID=A0A8J2T9I7_ZYGB2|nr:MPP6 (YNR024W) [Zygosaccharomyces parabailii]CDF91338.1 ZYBA0S11-00562g1_1 [Zygosaccharomyces bailii CLIB 213]CDH17235.1 uncharacterized protein ZBAI_09023 [Zygosaccharomyces bailii ISA1307]SJM86959.1 uncharacterized protein ZBIST_3148 [Zygosaccharomyces bailii]